LNFDRPPTIQVKALRQLIVIVPLVLSFWSTAASAQAFPYIEPPPLVRFTGALHPLEDKSRGGLLTLTVSIKDTKWIFRIAKVEKLTGGDASGWRLLQDLFPPQLRFVGPAELLRPLQDPEVAGKRLIIEGRLYTGDRMFYITSVEESAEKPQQTKPEGLL